jgi:hypothetical protein
MLRAVVAAIVLFAAIWAPAYGKGGGGRGGGGKGHSSKSYAPPGHYNPQSNPVGPSNSQKGYYAPLSVPYPANRPVWVNGYYRQDGSYVPGYWRHLPNQP